MTTHSYRTKPYIFLNKSLGLQTFHEVLWSAPRGSPKIQIKLPIKCSLHESKYIALKKDTEILKTWSPWSQG